MKPRINVITLTTDDLDRAVAFYRDGLGWHTDGIVGTEFEHGDVAFFELQHGQLLALYPREHQSAVSGLSGGADGLALSLGYNVHDAEAVDAATELVRRAGATIVRQPHHTAWGGYMSCFQDPDGHLWEIVYNPALSVEE